MAIDSMSVVGAVPLCLVSASCPGGRDHDRGAQPSGHLQGDRAGLCGAASREERWGHGRLQVATNPLGCFTTVSCSLLRIGLFRLVYRKIQLRAECFVFPVKRPNHALKRFKIACVI